MATRALAAEIRHDPQAFTTWVVEALEVEREELGQVSNVRCEAEENIDVVVTYESGTRVGIEAKFDHVVTDGQLARESDAVTHLVLLVLDQADAHGHEAEVDAVATWEELLARFRGTRLSQEDIDRIPATKKKVERRMQVLKLDDLLPEGWTTSIIRGDGGMSSIVLDGPTPEGGRRLCGQIQVSGRDSKRPIEEITLEYHVGVNVRLDEDDFPEDPKDRPTWLDDLDILGDVLQRDADRFTVRENSPRNGTSDLGKRKMPIVHEHLKGREWLAQGYCDWSLGAKSALRPLDELEALAHEAVALFVAWDTARMSASAAATS
ncbi:hypothetical protein [Clavibacter sepedonicus]|uniref:Uncharacterized protein n=2 Tax=Microbacteriaceae TaxID=85023 RepID=B0RG97_CLASE|nr:hypothetical protein [Clavibacter sepedonicus]CAQ02389.1 hypothetical protein CMS2302 [Clavibacter sepedonicus]